MLGIVEHTEDDFPEHIGIFDATDTFEEVRGLFVDELRLLNENRLDEWRQIRSQIESPGLKLLPIGGGSAVLSPLIHIEGVKAWWR